MLTWFIDLILLNKSTQLYVMQAGCSFFLEMNKLIVSCCKINVKI